MPVRYCKEQNDLFIDAEIGNAGDIQSLAVGGSARQCEDDLGTRIALDRCDDPEPVPRHDFPTSVIQKAAAGYTLDMGDCLCLFAERIEAEPFYGRRLDMRYAEDRNGKRENESNQS